MNILARRLAPNAEAFIELVGSMRFAVALLTILCIASIIGTVVPQGRAYPEYVNQFGLFWAEIFRLLDVYSVYGSWWYLSIIAFMILSTTLCVFRTTPKMFAEARSWKEHLHESSFRAFRLRGTLTTQLSAPQATASILAMLRHAGYEVRTRSSDAGTLVTSRKGGGNKWGFLLAHAGLVLIGLGALADGSFPIRFQIWFNGKQAIRSDAGVTRASAENVLSTTNPTYRGNISVTEGGANGQAMVLLDDGFIMQDLPFSIHLNRFEVDYYSTGMPRLFLSDVVLIDKKTGVRTPARIEFNKPFTHAGVTLYQSSFDDGGSKLQLSQISTGYGSMPRLLNGIAGGNISIPGHSGASAMTIELDEFKSTNVETISETAESLARKDEDQFRSLLGAATSNGKGKVTRNLGASLSYSVRDEAGQARRYLTMHLPIHVDGSMFYLIGVQPPNEQAFRFLRIPADDTGSMRQWLLLKQGLGDPIRRAWAARTFVEEAMPQISGANRERLTNQAVMLLDLFVGKNGKSDGLMALSEYMEQRVPGAERDRMAQIVMTLLQGSVFVLLNEIRAEHGRAPYANDVATAKFIQNSLFALSDLSLAGAPFILTLDGYDEVRASVFQVARAPGKYVVLFGSIGLTIGIVLMFYIHTRRVFIWLSPMPAPGDPRNAVTVLFAISSTRQTRDLHEDFRKLGQELNAILCLAAVTPEIQEHVRP